MLASCGAVLFVEAGGDAVGGDVGWLCPVYGQGCDLRIGRSVRSGGVVYVEMVLQGGGFACSSSRFW